MKFFKEIRKMWKSAERKTLGCFSTVLLFLMLFFSTLKVEHPDYLTRSAVSGQSFVF